MPRFEAAIFDLDGTLLNTLDDLAAACNHAMEAFGYPQHTKQEVCSYVGNGVELLIRRALPAGTSDETVQTVLTEFKRYYALHNNDATAPYPGIPEMLRRLVAAGVRCAIVSNKNDPNVKDLARVYFADTVTLAVGEREGVCRKPAPDTVLTVLKEWNIQPENALYIGDSDVDVKTARNAGTPCAAVLWGFRDEACLRGAGAEMLFADAATLCDYILG